ncbi:MAG: Hsp20/alpha crystallin family protein [Burkholderiaceae bacterium]|nr:Hsp20/alpha crystallin family protein [Burkholderiaceae bacterium]
MNTALVPFVRRDVVAPVFEDLLRDVWSASSLLSSAFFDDVLPQGIARMDVLDKGASYEVVIDLPGVRKEDIEVSVDGTQVQVSAERRREQANGNGERVLYAERALGRYMRRFELPAEVTEVGAQARYENGVLVLTLPKAGGGAKRLTVH